MSDPFLQPKIVDKPWGREIWFADQAAYAGKILEVRKGTRLSLQYHERKTETLYLMSGKMKLVFHAMKPGELHAAVKLNASDEFIWEPGKTVHIPVRTIHRFEALEDSILLESSTPDLTDIVRLQDDFSRPARD
jgi:mannose-6-phosphate isomerase-like protein (cupin superfamily)